MIESILAALLQSDDSDEGLTHVGQSLHGIETISGCSGNSTDGVVGDGDGGSEGADLRSKIAVLGREIADDTDQLTDREYSVHGDDVSSQG